MAPDPLTLQTLVAELEKFRKSMATEFTASLNAALAPIHSSLETITSTVAKHSSTIVDMEKALTAHSDDITGLQKEVAELRVKMTSMAEEQVSLQSTTV